MSKQILKVPNDGESLTSLGNLLDWLSVTFSEFTICNNLPFFSCLLHYTLIKLFVLGLLKHQTVVGTYLWVCDLQWIRETTGVREDTYGDISQIKVECAMFKFFVVLLRNATSDSYLAFSKPLTPFFELGTYPFQNFFFFCLNLLWPTAVFSFWESSVISPTVVVSEVHLQILLPHFQLSNTTSVLS